MKTSCLSLKLVELTSLQVWLLMIRVIFIVSDIFMFDSHNYLLVVDYMSHSPVICQLTSMTAKVVTEHLKAIFNELGVPDVLVSDNGPCYLGNISRQPRVSLELLISPLVPTTINQMD